MCGIVGFIDGHSNERALDVLLQSMVHRGPDGDGRFIDGALHMGMRRLSVIDIEGGWQPLFSLEGGVVAFQNGEIYNHIELRQDLERLGYSFKTRSDTESLAHGYDAWGIDGLLARVDGMYGLAIYDRQNRLLHLARDRFGEKPLFFSEQEGRFCYGSTLTAVAAMPWVGSEIDRIALDRYLALHFSYGDRTILRDVRRVLPGQRVTVSVDQATIVEAETYYRPALSIARRIDDDELADTFERAVRSRLIADVPVGVFLSGGLDSSLVAAAAVRANPNVATFSMGFGDPAVDESVHARAVADEIGSKHYEYRFDQADFELLLPQVAAALDEPVGDQAMLPLFWLCREARKDVTVVLSGEGADEIFGGYSYYQPYVTAEDWQSRFRRLLSAEDATGVKHQGRLVVPELGTTQSGFPLLASAEERRRVTGTEPKLVADEIEKLDWLDGARNPLQRATAADLCTWLPDDLLVKLDRMGMAHSLEGRAPYLQPDLVALGLNLPEHERLCGATSKVALRRIGRRYLPEHLLERPKQGFVLPMRLWVRDWFGSHGGPQAYFRTRPIPGVDLDRLALLAEDSVQQSRERLSFALILLAEWWHAFEAQQKALIRSLRTATLAISQ